MGLRFYIIRIRWRNKTGLYNNNLTGNSTTGDRDYVKSKNKGRFYYLSC